tara:strand:- start:82 stop:603 length:522 start_codon:yes stop_codon:yes gene_type:complete
MGSPFNHREKIHTALLEGSSMALIYVDMDNVLVDFKSGMQKLGLDEDIDDPDDIPDIFSLMEPMPGAIDGFNKLHGMGHDVYILSTAPWENPSAWSDKLVWVKKYLGDVAYKKLILSHHKNLNEGDYLIDDRDQNGAGEWGDRLLRFGFDRKTGESFEYPDWDSIIDYFKTID